jgi:hypothetical protein
MDWRLAFYLLKSLSKIVNNRRTKRAGVRARFKAESKRAKMQGNKIRSKISPVGMAVGVAD